MSKQNRNAFFSKFNKSITTFVSHADGYAVFKVQRAKRQRKSRHKTDEPCLRFFWKVMLVDCVMAESLDVQPRRVRTNI